MTLPSWYPQLVLYSFGVQPDTSNLSHKIAAIVYCGQITVIISAGYGRHESLLSREEYKRLTSDMIHSLVWGKISTILCKVSVTLLLHRAIEIKIFRVISILLVAIASVVSLFWVVLLEITSVPSRELPKLGLADGGE